MRQAEVKQAGEDTCQLVTACFHDYPHYCPQNVKKLFRSSTSVLLPLEAGGLWPLKLVMAWKRVEESGRQWLGRAGEASRQDGEEEVPPDQLFKWQHDITPAPSADLGEDTKGVQLRCSQAVLCSSSGF